MESFETAPVIRFYGSEASEGSDEAALAADRPASPVDRPQRRLVAPKPARAPGRIAILAAFAGAAAVGLATWAFVSVVRTVKDESPAAPPPRVPAVAKAKAKPKPKPTRSRALALLASPSTERYPVAGAMGRITVAVTPGDRGYLVLNGLWHAPSGRVYVAWLAPPTGGTIRPAATFRGGSGLVPLRAQVREGAAVAVTLERAGSTSRPSRTPRLVAIRR